ncbi:MAG: SMC family ATPase, partial [Clostridiales bacterium]|nr:SMC family ATPase [Clostridiales bacterium]
ELYQVLQDKLKEESAALSRQREALCSSIRQYIDGIVCKDDDVLSIELEKAKSGNLPISDTLTLVDALIKQDEQEQAFKKAALSETERQLSEITSLLTKAEERNKAKAGLLSAKSELAVKTSRLETLVAIFEKEKAGQPKVEQLSESITIAKNKLPQYDEFEEMKAELAANKDDLMNKTEKNTRQKDELRQKTKAAADMKAELESLRDADAEKEKLLRHKAISEDKQKTLADLNGNMSVYEKLRGEAKTAQEEFNNATKKIDILYHEYSFKNKAFLAEQAGILANSLADGVKCPVCGSTEHPAPAQLTKGAPSEVDINKAKNTYDKARDAASGFSAKAGKLIGQAEAKKEEIANQAAALFAVYDYAGLASQIKLSLSEAAALIKDINAKIESENAKITRKSELDASLPEAEAALNTLSAAIAENDKVIAALESSIKNKAEAISKLAGALDFGNKEEAEAHIAKLVSEKSELQQAFDKAQNDLQECRAQVESLQGAIMAFSQQLRDSAEIDTEAQLERQSVLKAEKALITDSLEHIAARLKTNKTALNNISTQSGVLSDIEAKWTWVKTLSNTANGNISGKEKIMLETYIKMTCFDRIIARANTRFMLMSGGQYELKRRIDADDNRSQSGLELDVIDHYNGTERNVKTLSGGESFKASLSLALGLSDEIQSSSGGIRLDTMFVDEGFGALDEESLRQAINALKSLTEANRLVGIISHVPQLKDRIDKQIIVTKEKSGGSRVEMIYY